MTKIKDIFATKISVGVVILLIILATLVDSIGMKVYEALHDKYDTVTIEYGEVELGNAYTFDANGNKILVE